MKMKETQSTNPELVKLIRFLKKQSKEQKAGVWHDVAENLSKSRSGRAAVNLSRINRNTEKRDIVVVPGKILGTGSLNHALTIAAFDVSAAAEKKLKASRAKYLSIPELVKKNPTGANVKIIR
jgi:large subunit ribosomal protein L18e